MAPLLLLFIYRMPSALSFVGLHYWAGSGREFEALQQLLAPDFYLHAPDLPGFGAVPPLADCAVAAYADHVGRYAEAQGLERYVLLGHSMGGKIALALAARQPRGLAGVVLLSPSPPCPEPMTEAERQAAIHAFGVPAEAEKTFWRITALPLPKAIEQQIVQDNLRSSAPAYHAWLQQGSREDISARMTAVQVPCLLLAGTHDRVLSPAVHREHTLPFLPLDTPMELITRAGHLLPYEAPEKVAAHLRVFGQRL